VCQRKTHEILLQLQNTNRDFPFQDQLGNGINSFDDSISEDKASTKLSLSLPPPPPSEKKKKKKVTVELRLSSLWKLSVNVLVFFTSSFCLLERCFT
jgi:hypothetical protein